jgi:hypothetical protein
MLIKIKIMYHQTREEAKESVLYSLREGMLLTSEVRFLIDAFEEVENYEACAGAIDALNEYKKQLDEI